MADREIKIILAFLLAFLLFLYGAYAATLKIFPYKYIEPLMLAGEGLAGAFKMEEYNAEVRWVQKANNNTGLVFSDSARIGDGYTVYSSTHDTTVRMVDMDGTSVHEWSFKFNDIWDNQDHILSLQMLPDRFFYARDFHVYDNGDLLVMVAAAGVTPWGLGVLKLDKDSNLIWKHTGYPNNDFEVGPDGRIYIVEHEIEPENLEEYKLQSVPFMEDHIVQLSPDGKEIKRASLIEAITRSPYKDMLMQLTFDETGDPTHSNSIEYVRETNPDVPWLKRGNLLISIRNINAIAVYDPQSDEVVHAFEIRARQQHDIDVLDTGNLMIFDNQGSFTEGGYSRVFEFDPVSQEIVWNYDPAQGEDGLKFESKFWGCQDRLSNGNTIIAHAQAGRIIEVAPNYDIVWDYRTPLLHDVEGADHVPAVTTMERLSPSRASFLNKD